MKILVGIDVQPIDEVATSIRDFGDRYRRRLFTSEELAFCGDGPSSASGLAARFAAKEAVLKVLDTRTTVPSWRSIEVQRLVVGPPTIMLHGDAADLARAQGLSDLSLSLSHGGGIATAAVIATFSSEYEEIQQ